MYLFTYWENPKQGKPSYISLCEKIINQYNDIFQIKHLNQNTVNNLITVPPSLITSSERNDLIALKVDYIKVALLEKYGGIWLDLDTIILPKFPSIKFLINNFDFIYTKQDAYNKIYAGVDILISQKKGKVITEYLKLLNAIIEGKSSFKREEFGSVILTPIVQSLSKYCHEIPNNSAHPIPFTECHLFFENRQSEEFIDQYTLCVVLYNSIFPKYIKQLSINKLLKKDILLSRILKLALVKD